MSASLRLSKGDNFVEDTKLIPAEQECAGFKVDLLAGHASDKAQNFESDSDTLSEDDEENDTSDDDRKIANNPVLKERLRHLEKYASSFRYAAEPSTTDIGISGYNEDFVVDYRRSASDDKRPHGQFVHEPLSVQQSIETSVSNQIPASMSSEKNPSLLYGVPCISGRVGTSLLDKKESLPMSSRMGFFENNYANHPSINSTCDKSPAGDSDEFECELCGAIYTNRSSLRSHLKKHAGQIMKRHQCHHCPYSTQYGKNLLKHIESTHVEASECNHHCESCNLNFPTELLLRNHEQTHSAVSNYQCEECGRTFKTKLRLKYHADIHNPRKPYICDVEGCDRAFRTPKYLKNHRDEFHHMQPKQYLCPVDGCPLVFHRKTHLKRHVATHDDSEKKFHCTWPECQRRFRTKESLDLHYNKHTGENPFHCDLCTFTCQEKGILTDHYRQKHSKTSFTSPANLMCPSANSFAALHRPLPPPPLLQTTAGGGILPASGSDLNEVFSPIEKDGSIELFSPNSPSVGQTKNVFAMTRTTSSTSVPHSTSPSVSPSQQNLVSDSANAKAHILPSLLTLLEKTADLDPNAPESVAAREYARSLLPPFVTGEALDEQVNLAVDEVIASLKDQPIHVVHAVFASSRALSSDELHMVETLENQLTSSSGVPLVAPAPPRKRGRRPKLQQLLQPHLERLYNLEPCTAEAMVVHLVSCHNSHLLSYAGKDPSIRGRSRCRGRGRGHSRGPDGVHWLPDIDGDGDYDHGSVLTREQYIGAVRRGGPGSRGRRGRGACRMQVMDYLVSRQFSEGDGDKEEDAEEEEEIDDCRNYSNEADEIDPSTQLRRTQSYSRQKMLNESEVDDEHELDNLGVDEEMPEQNRFDQSMDLRKPVYTGTPRTPMNSLGMYTMVAAANHRFEGRNCDGLGEVLEDLGCIARHRAVVKREAALYLPADVAEKRNGEVDVCSQRSSAACTPSHGPVPLPSMAALASTSPSPTGIAPGSGKTNHGHIGPASAASTSTMSPLVGGLGGTNHRPPSRPLAHQASVPECSQVTSPILHYPSSSAGMHCNPPSAGGPGGMGPWSESSYGSSSQEAYKQAPLNVFLHTSPNPALQYRQHQQQQHPGSVSPEFHHLQREQIMPSNSPSQRIPTSNPYLAHQQQHNHRQATPPAVATASDAVDHLRSLSALGAKYTQTLPEPIDLGEQREPHPMLGSGCGMPPASLGGLLSGGVKSEAFLQFSGTPVFRSNSFKDRSPQSRGGNLPPDGAANRVSNGPSMYSAALARRQASSSSSSYGEGGDGGVVVGCPFSRGATAVSSGSPYGINGDYYQQLQAHVANTRQLLADGTFNTVYSQGGGSSHHSYAGSSGPGFNGQLDLSVSTGNRSFQQPQQSSNSLYGSDSRVARFGGSEAYEESAPTQPHPYYNTNPRPDGAPPPPPLGMYEQNYRSCYPNNPSMAAVAAAAYNYHYQQQQQHQQQHQQETDLPYDRVPYDYGRNRYLF